MEGWRARGGRFYAGPNAEQYARDEGANTWPCRECGQGVTRSPRLCLACTGARERAEFEKLESIPYSKAEYPLTLQYGDRYFWEEDQLLDWLADNDIAPADAMVLTTYRTTLRRVDEDYWCDELPGEDGELPDDVRAAVALLNEVIEEREYIHVMPTQTRVVLPRDLLEASKS